MTAEGPPEPVLVVLQLGRGTLSVTGADAKTWLNGLVSCDVLKVSEGRAGFGLLLNKQGKIQSEAEVVATPTGLLVGVSPGTSAHLMALLDKFLVMEDAELSDVSERYSWADFYGLGSAALAGEAARICSGTPAAINFTEQPSAVLVFERDRLPELQRFIERAPALRQATESDWNGRRIEQNLGCFGVDFGEADNPHEAALDRRAVSWSKGCYLGQEVVCMQDMRGKLKRRLISLVLDETAELPAVGFPVTAAAEGEVIGELTSVARGSQTGKVLAMARVKAPYFEGKSALFVDGRPAAFIDQGAPEIE